MDTLFRLYLRSTISLYPHELAHPTQAILQKLYGKIQKWDPQIQVKPGAPRGALLLAFDKCKIHFKEAKMLAEDPTLVHYPVCFEGLVFAPLPGERITASLTHVLHNTVFLNLMDLFTVQVPLAPEMNEHEEFKIEAEHEKKLRPDLDVELLEDEEEEENKEEGGLLLDVDLPVEEQEEDNESDHYSILRQYFVSATHIQETDRLQHPGRSEAKKSTHLQNLTVRLTLSSRVKITGEKRVIFASQLRH